MPTDRFGYSREQKSAIRACKVGLAGDLDVETARGLFIDFARKKNLLVEEAPSRCQALSTRVSTARGRRVALPSSLPDDDPAPPDGMTRTQPAGTRFSNFLMTIALCSC